jgi:uncharacterized protein
MTSGSAPTLDEKVHHLASPSAYPDRTTRVTCVRTHMACVFLTDRFAYKLKKPIRSDYVDYVDIAARLGACRAEVRLNRRLAPDVYLGILPLAVDTRRRLVLGGRGEVVDWLVHMHRLPEEQMLERRLSRGVVIEKRELEALGLRLARFYQSAPRAEWSPPEYVERLAADARRARAELGRPRYRLSTAILDEVTEAQLGYLRSARRQVEARAAAGHVVDAHGDLRPEHVCLAPEPRVIDCLEFDRELRLLDWAAELAFLRLECDRLGGVWAGRAVFDACAGALGDEPPRELMAFYTSQHAMVRAKLAAFHIDDSSIADRARFERRASDYLDLAAASVRAL